MLNISHNSITDNIDRQKFKALQMAESRSSGRVLLRLLLFFGAVGLVICFLPWTQNIRTNGRVTTLRPDQKPQTIHSIIPGRIEKWFVMEGDFVQAGDTIVFLSEMKEEYLNPDLLQNTTDQLEAKELSVRSYMEKVKAVDVRIDALIRTGRIKLEQAQNKMRMAELKILSDSADFNAARLNESVAKEQLLRMEQLHAQGLKSLTDLESRKIALQKATAERISKENSLLASRNELLNAKAEMLSISAQYKDDVAKAESDKYGTLSAMYDAEAAVTQLQNRFMNYTVRSGMYYVTAPQTGYITKAVKGGLGEIIKEGEPLVSIMPDRADLATEMYVRPIDLPLLEIGNKVRIQFDGWPAIVFSGWPNTSYGTYGGVVFAIDNFTSPDGRYRVLVAPDPEDHPWPEALRVGSATDNMVLLQEVPIWYELWRQFNGFPPDYYKSTPVSEKK